MERLPNSYKLETLEGTLLDGIFHERCLRSFIPREGTALAAEQEKLEKTLTLEEPNNAQLLRPGEGAQESVEHEDLGNSGQEDAEQGEAASGGSEEDECEGNESGGNAGFFYENKEGERPGRRRLGHWHQSSGKEMRMSP